MQKILAKLTAIAAETGYIQKDKKNAHFGYNYASEQAIKETLHPLLVKHGVLFFPVECSLVRREQYTSDKGKRSCLTDISMTYRFYDSASGEFVEGTFCGTGDDAADKGTYKAVTGAIKYILTSTFLIPTGDDPENDENDKPQPKAEPKPSAPPPPKADPSKAIATPLTGEPKRNLGSIKTNLKELANKGRYGKQQLNDLVNSALIEYNKTCEPPVHIGEFAEIECHERAVEIIPIILAATDAEVKKLHDSGKAQ